MVDNRLKKDGNKFLSSFPFYFPTPDSLHLAVKTFQKHCRL